MTVETPETDKARRQTIQWSVDIWRSASLVIVVNVVLLFAIRFLVDGYQLVADPDFFPSIVNRPELSNVIEPRDQLLSLLVVFQPIIVGLALYLTGFLRKLGKRSARVLSLCIPLSATLLLASLIRWRDTRPLYASWRGFEVDRVAVCFVVVVSAFEYARRSQLALRALKIWVPAFGSLLICLFLPYFLQFATSVRDGYHSRFIIDEILAASSGSAPLVNYTAQYAQLVGLPLVPVIKIFDSQSVNAAVALVSVLQISVLVLLFVLFRRLVGNRWGIGALTLVIISMLTAAPGASLSASVVSYWAVMPIRAIGPLGLIVLSAFLNPGSKSRTVLIGVISGVVAINNPDWGLPALLGILCSISVSSGNLQLAMRGVGRIVLGTFLSFVGVFLLLLPWGVPQPSRLFEFVWIFGSSGYFAVPTLPWGLHLAVFGSHVACLFLGLAESPLFSRSTKSSVLASTMTCAGIVGLGSFLYFVNRSLTAVLASTFVFWTISVLLLLIFICQHRSSFGSNRLSLLNFLPVLLLVSTVLSVFQLPSPSAEFSRLRGEVPSMNFDLDRIAKESIAKVELALDDLRVSSEHVGLIGLNTSWLALRTGTKNLTNYNGVDSIVTFAQAKRLCTAIRRSGVTHVIVTDIPAAPEVLQVLRTCSRVASNQTFVTLLPNFE